MKAAIPLFSLSLAIFGFASLSARTPAVDSHAISFGRDIQPILSQHCYKCHGPDAAKAAAGLRLDSFAGATSQLGNGAGIVPGKPDASLIIQKVSNPNPNLRMPPPDSGVQALTAEQIDKLRTWISAGARYERHWSFVAPVMPAIPKVSNPAWAKNLVDRFVLAKLDEEGLKPEPEADKETLAMRASQTLTGLPPTTAELKAFEQDQRPGAYERYVDRLLASPAYGEHEARYWLDAVRYGDTHGLQLDNERAIYPYRDWVIGAFNEDLPFDKFVKWQVAGDLLPHPDTEQLIATGYVRMNLTSNEGGAIPEEFLARNTFDRVDTTSTALLGLTIGCAKCHDHKFDPIKQADYYGLYAYFDSTKDDPLDGNLTLPPPYIRASTKGQEAQMAAMDAQLNGWRNDVDPAVASTWLSQNHQSPPSSRDWQESPIYSSKTFDEAFDKAEPGEPGQPAATWKPFKFEPGKDAANLIGKDNSSIYVRGTIRVEKDRTIHLSVSSDDAVRLWLNGKLIHSHKINRGLSDAPDDVKADFRAGDNELIAKVINGAGPDGLNIRLVDANETRIDKALAAYKKAPTDAGTILELRSTYLEVGPNSANSSAYRRLLKKRTDFEAAIPMTLIAKEMDTPRPTFILKRGLYDQKGDAVERHIPAVLGKLPNGAPNNRLGLADWLTDPANPLVARVFVNRLWQQHFGTGIVKTVEDLGTQGEWPLNQPLLDYLAVSFVKNGWSVKKLNRLIVTSAAFRQGSQISSAKLAKDPENRFISRGPRFRLDAEVIRDKALAAGGLLVQRIGGHGFKPYQPDGLWEGSSDPASGTHIYVQDHGKEIYRRSLYMFWKRTSPPPVMVTFDAPLRDTCIVRRSVTNTPLQALALLNEPGLLEASRTMAARVIDSAKTEPLRLRSAYEIAMGHEPNSNETAILLKSLNRYENEYRSDETAAKKLLNVGEAPQSKTIDPAEQAAWMVVCSTIMNTNEFLTQH
ncbi:MAG TPA: DUF1553 domain-containing protein [Fimbriimonadaceae bacterium]|jgi:mono/diheme cytochrome c family protein